jgi:hypothetical protein
MKLRRRSWVSPGAAEAADILDRYEFGQHRLVPRDRFASETGKAGLARLDQK